MFWLQVPTPRSGQHEPGCHIDWVKSWFWKFIISLIIHSVMSDFATPWTVACQPPLSMGFPRQEYWSGGWGGRWEGGSGWGTHVNPWLIHVNGWQKPLQYCKVISLQLIKIIGRKKKRILEWVAISFSRVSSRLRDWTHISFIAGRFFISWASGSPIIMRKLLKIFKSQLSYLTNSDDTMDLTGWYKDYTYKIFSPASGLFHILKWYPSWLLWVSLLCWIIIPLAQQVWSFANWKLWPDHLIFSPGGGLVAKSCPTLMIPWNVARQAPLSMGFSRQEYWSG